MCLRVDVLMVAGLNGLLNRKQLCGDILAFPTPGQGAEVAFPSQFDMLPRASHQGVGQGTVGHREFELVAAQSHIGVVHGFEAAFYYLAFIGFEDYALVLEVVDIAGIDTGAVDEKEAEKNEGSQYNDYHRCTDCDDFTFARYCHDDVVSVLQRYIFFLEQRYFFCQYGETLYFCSCTKREPKRPGTRTNG